MTRVRGASVVVKVLAELVAGILLIQGCALTLQRYESPPISGYENVQIKDGLAMAVRPLLDDEESRRYFGKSLLSEGIVAVYVLSENQSASSSFRVPKSGMSLVAGVPKILSSEDKIQSSAAADALVISGAVLLSPLVAGIGVKLLSDASVINHSIRTQEFLTKTLSPGQTAGGFIYFQLPDKVTLPARWAIRVEASETAVPEDRIFIFTFGKSEEPK
jgi:hypothetical protein